MWGKVLLYVASSRRRVSRIVGRLSLTPEGDLREENFEGLPQRWHSYLGRRHLQPTLMERSYIQLGLEVCFG